MPFRLRVGEVLRDEASATGPKDALDRLLEASGSRECAARDHRQRRAVRVTLPVRRLDEAQAARHPIAGREPPADVTGGA